jgi:hypothetical protein
MAGLLETVEGLVRKTSELQRAADDERTLNNEFRAALLDTKSDIITVSQARIEALEADLHNSEIAESHEVFDICLRGMSIVHDSRSQAELAKDTTTSCSTPVESTRTVVH